MECPCTSKPFKNHKQHSKSKQHVYFMLCSTHWIIPVDGHDFSEKAKHLHYPIEGCYDFKENDKLWFVTEPNKVQVVATYSHTTMTDVHYTNLYWIDDVSMTMEYPSSIVNYHRDDKIWIGTRAIELTQEYVIITNYR